MAVVGCGRWGLNYTRVVSQMPHFQLAAVVDLDQKRLDGIKSSHPGVETFTALAEMIGKGGIDAAIVATTPETHFDLTASLLKAGIPVLVEKPLTLTSAHSKELTRLAAERNVTLMVGHTFVYNSGVNKLKEIIDTNDIGQIYYLYATRTNMGPIREDVDAVWDLAPHDVSIYTYLLNEFPCEVNAVGSTYLNHRHCDVAYITLRFPSGIIGNVHVSWIDPFKVREVILVGSKMRIIFNDMSSLEPIRIYHKGVESSAQESESFGHFKLLMRDGDIHIPKVAPSEPLRNQVNVFAEAIKTRGPVASDGLFGHKIVCVLEAIQQSIRQHGQPISVNYDL